MFGVSARALPKAPMVHAWEPVAFVVCGSILLLIALLYALRRIAYPLATALT